MSTRNKKEQDNKNRNLASEQWSDSSSQTWEGIEGYEADFIRQNQIQTDIGPVRGKQEPSMMSKEDFAKMYGFIYGEDIDAAYQEAMNARFNEMDAGTRLARDTQLQDMSSSHDQYLQSLRQQRARSPQTGIQKGSSMAAELQGMFGSQNQMQESQQYYQDTVGKLSFERGTAAEEARLGALKDKNMIAGQMGQLGSEKYGYDVQNEAAYLGYLGEYGQNQANMVQAAGAWNAAEGQNVRRQTSNQNSSSYSYDDSANIAAQAQRYAADQSAAAQRYASDQSAAAYAAQQAEYQAQSEAAKKSKDPKEPKAPREVISTPPNKSEVVQGGYSISDYMRDPRFGQGPMNVEKPPASHAYSNYETQAPETSDFWKNLKKR